MKGIEVRINVHPASFRNKTLEAAERKLGTKLKGAARRLEFDGGIDIDYFDDESGAYAALIVEVFDERGNRIGDVLAREVLPVHEEEPGDSGEIPEAVETIENSTPKIVQDVRKLIQSSMRSSALRE